LFSPEEDFPLPAPILAPGDCMSRPTILKHVAKVLEKDFGLKVELTSSEKDRSTGFAHFGKDEKERPLFLQIMEHSLFPAVIDEDKTLPKVPHCISLPVLSFFLVTPFDVSLEKAHEVAWFLLLENNRHLLSTFHYQPPHLVFFSCHIPLHDRAPCREVIASCLYQALMAKKNVFPLIEALSLGEKTCKDLIEEAQRPPLPSRAQ
jgi:hypothetical protein